MWPLALKKALNKLAHTSSEDNGFWFKSFLYHLLAVCVQAICLIPLNLSFLICKMGNSKNKKLQRAEVRVT